MSNETGKVKDALTRDSGIQDMIKSNNTVDKEESDCDFRRCVTDIIGIILYRGINT